MSLVNNVQPLTDGGIAVVVLGRGFALPTELAQHAQLLPMELEGFPTTLPALAAKAPGNTRVFVIAGELPQYEYGLVTKLAQRRNVPYVIRRNMPAVTDVLTSLLPRRPAIDVDADAERDARREQRERDEATASAAIAVAADTGAPSNGNGSGTKAVAPKGAITALVKEHADLTKSPAEEARRLLTLAQQAGIPTTFGSISQQIGAAKRAGGRTAVPRSVMSAQQRALATLDEAIAGLQLIREYVEKTEKENAEMRTTIGAFKQLLGQTP